jgi:hypothetical protein
MTAQAKTPNYSAEAEALIVARARDAGGKLTLVDAEKLAIELGRTVKSLTAKLSRMGMYQAKTYVTKNGEKAVKKDTHAEAIGAILQLTEAEVDSLTKANKTALVKVFNALANSKPIEG